MNRQLSTFFKEQTEHLTGSTGLEHWLIESDNLPAMKALLTTHSQAIDLIYIDPPYNTGHTTLAYNDRLPSHEAWIDFMRKRLLLARQLLASDGAIFISIDQHELFRLGTLCNEIFGEKNCLGIITLVNNLKGRSDGKHFAVCNEFMLAYAINAEKIHMKLANIDEEEIDRDYQHSDGKGHYKLTGFRKTGKAWRREDRPYMYYPILWRGLPATRCPWQEGPLAMGVLRHLPKMLQNGALSEFEPDTLRKNEGTAGGWQSAWQAGQDHLV